MEPVSTDVDFVALEKEIQRHWDRTASFDQLRELRAQGPLFRFVDGPITANNPMGIHHAWGRTLKDVFLRYRAMNGRQCNYQNGFDCQGLWVEVEVEKALGFNGKPDIERFGIENFSRACRERVEKYAAVISEQSARLGQWMDWEHSYYTMDDENMLGIWRFLAECHKRGWIYEGALPMPWCPRCGTSLSEHEMTGSYERVEHLSVFVRAPLVESPDRRLLVWTTTPWTLPANTALAVNPGLDYVEVTAPEWDHTLILGAQTVESSLGGTKVEVVRRFRGSELAGLAYRTFLPDLPAQADVDHRIVEWSEVDEQEGTGIVHIAPGCGLADHELGRQENLAVLAPVDGSGVYQEGYDWLTGRATSEVDREIADHLQQTGRLLRAEMYEHSYPLCWRCKGQLIFRLVGEWFISSDEVRPRLIEAARTVEWIPDYMLKRMEDWLNNMGDWCISRKRYWGLSLPFYPCQACGNLTVIGSREELRERAVSPEKVDDLPELHRPWIDAVRIACPECGAEVQRVPEVGDCWLDAGIVPFTTLGYFEDRAAWEGIFPVEWICEMREQVRLWYYSMLFMSVVLDGRAPYQKVLSYERVVSEEGAKFSKTGHMIHFDDAVERIGADAIRYLFCRQSVSAECRFGYGLGEISRRRLTSLWNVYSFFVLYALVDRPESAATVPLERCSVADRWLLARTWRFLEVARSAYDAWDTTSVLREFEDYVEELSNWYVRTNRRRFWREDSPDKAACYAVLYTAIKCATQILAPISPFVTEEIWRNLVLSIEPEAPQSVHHSLFPQLPTDWRDDALLNATAQVRELISEGLRLRQQAEIRVRQPLPALYVKGADAALAAIREQEEVVRNELNVSRVAYVQDTGPFETQRLELNFKAAGSVLRNEVSTVKAALESLSDEEASRNAEAVSAGREIQLPGVDYPLQPQLFHVRQDLKSGFQAGQTRDFSLWLDLRAGDDLLREGLVRDLIRRIQIARRDAGFEITQRIALRIETEAPELDSAVREHSDKIREEVLATTLEHRLDGSEGSQAWTIQDFPVRVAMEPIDG